MAKKSMKQRSAESKALSQRQSTSACKNAAGTDPAQDANKGDSAR